MSVHPISVIHQFWRYVRPGNKNECWEWTGSLMICGGYGQLNYNGKLLKAHRVSYEIHFGKIGKGLFACHRCNNAKCCNPFHIYAGTPKENWQDTIDAGNAYEFPILKGTNANSSKLTQKQVDFIRSNKISPTLLGKQFGVTRQTITLARKGTTYAQKS